MAEKLSWSELRRAVAARANVTEKVANDFLTAMNAQLIEALKTEKQVKINGLGTFKLQAVAPRKSVNVTTGEEITIDGYNKIAFAPEAGVKELVESGGEPQGEPEGFVGNVDPLKKLGAQAAEIAGLLEELGQSPKEEKEEEPVAEAPVAEEPVVEAPVAEEPAPEPEPEPEPEVKEPEPAPEPEPEPEVKEPEPAPVVEEPAPESVAEEPAAEEPAPVPEPEPEKKEPEKKKNHFWRDTLICVVVLLILLVVGYFFFRQQIGNWIKSFIEGNKTEMVAEPVVEEPEEQTIPMPEVEEVIVEEVKEEVPEVSPEPEKIVYKKLKKTEAITNGSRLTWIALKSYGSKIYWPYLYDANRDRIKNPNIIKIGTPIRVPKLTATQLDTTNAQTMATINRLRMEAEAAMH